MSSACTSPGYGSIANLDRASMRTSALAALLIFLPCIGTSQNITIGFSSSQYQTSENNATAKVYILRSGDTSAIAHITCSTGQGTAQPGVDYVPASEIVTFAAGENQKEFTIGLIDNGTIDISGNRRVRVELTNPSSNAVIGTGTADITLLENELASFLDPRFSTGFGPNNSVFALGLYTNGSVYIGGEFSLIEQSSDVGLSRLRADGTVDPGFAPNAPPGAVYAIAVHPNGSVTAGGSTLQRFLHTGTRDTSFNPSPNDEVRALVVDSQERLIVGGRFTTFAGEKRNRLARTDVNGVLDSSFAPDVNGNVRALALQASGEIVLGGQFTTVDGVARSRIARVTDSGALDTSFDPGVGADGQVRALAVQTNGQIIAGGEFSSMRGFQRPFLARLNSDGTLDESFAPVLDGIVRAVAVQPDGRILVGGNFRTVNGISRPYVARLLSSGALDDTLLPFDPILNNEVFAFGLLPDGQFYLAGQFTTDSPVRSRRVARAIGNSLTTYFTMILDSSYPETNSTAQILVRRSGDTTQAANVTVTTQNGSAVAGLDYSATTTVASFAPFQTQTSVAIPILNDGIPEYSEYFVVSLTAPSADAIANTAPRQVYIADNDLPINFLPEFLYSTVSADERDSTVTLRIRRQDDGPGVVTVICETAESIGNDHAIAGEDYVPISETVTFNSNSETQTVHVPLINNCRQTGPLKFRVILRDLSGVGAIGNGALNVTIADDEQPWTIDRSFVRSSNDLTITHEVTLPDGRILAAGTLRTNGVVISAPVVRLHPNGTPDAAFRLVLTNYDRLNQTHAFAVASNGSWAAAFNGIGTEGFYYGYFGMFPPESSTGIVFTTGIDSSTLVRSMAWQSDSKLVIGGNFGAFAAGVTPNLARMLANGTADPNFNPVPGEPVVGLAIAPDGRIVCIRGSQVVRLLRDGQPDPSFTPATLDGLAADIYPFPIIKFQPTPILTQLDGGIIVGGQFTGVNGTPRVSLARLSQNGTLDTNYAPNLLFNAFATSAMALQSDGKLLVIFFSWVGDVPPVGTIVRLLPDGTLDPAFPSGLSFDWNYYFHLQSDGRAIVNSLSRGTTRYWVDPPIALHPPRLTAPGVLHLSGNAILGAKYILQGTSDFVTWHSISTNVASDCTIRFTNSVASPHQFYRLAP